MSVNRIKLSLAILFLLLAMACTKKELSPLDDFSAFDGQVLKGKEFRLANDSILYMPYNFSIRDSIGIFNDISGSTAVTLVNMNDGSIIKKFVFSGDQESDFDINAISVNSAINSKSDFTVLQLNPPCKVVRYNWGKLLTSSYKPNPIYYTKKFGYNSSFLLNDSTIFGQLAYSKFDNKMFAIANISSNTLTTGLDLPRFENKAFDHYYQDSTFYSVFKSVLNLKLQVRPGSNFEFVYFSGKGALMQIFDIDRDNRFNVKYEKVYYLPLFNVVSTPQQTRAKMLPGSKNGFNDVAVTEKKIYTLFNGSDKGEVFCDDILVYDWQGNPVEKLKLDRKCRRISIDENNPKVMFAMYGATNVRLVKYILP